MIRNEKIRCEVGYMGGISFRVALKKARKNHG